MSWRDTVMTQTELYDKLDEVTAERDALASRLDVASTLVAEIVAYFDVLDNPMSQVPEWPRDWLKRAKAFPVEKQEIKS